MAIIQRHASSGIQFMHSRATVITECIDTNYKKESGVFILRNEVSFIIKAHSLLKRIYLVLKHLDEGFMG